MYSLWISYQTTHKTKSATKAKKRKYGVIVTKAENKTSSTPLLVILGWDPQLNSADPLGEKDWPSIRLPLKSSVTKSSKKVRSISLYMIELVKELTVRNQPVIFSIYGEEGCVIYSQMTDILTTPGQDDFNAFEIAASICNENKTPNSKSFEKPLPAKGVMERLFRMAKNPVTFGVLCEL